MHPPTLAAAALASLAGRYAKPDAGPEPAEILVREGGLWLQLPKHPPARLSPMTQEIFSVEGYDALRVRLRGRTLELLWRDETVPRVYRRS